MTLLSCPYAENACADNNMSVGAQMWMAPAYARLYALVNIQHALRRVRPLSRDVIFFSPVLLLRTENIDGMIEV